MSGGALAACAVTLAFAACAGSEGMPADGGDAGGGAPGDAGEAGSPAGMSCQQIRLCVFGTPCATDDCVAACAARGTPEAQAAYASLRACTARTCGVVGDVICACGEQCQADGTCLHEADVCLGTEAVDDICDSLCA
jgi:hypothetical protein